jgi:hypothetical protein
MDAHTSLLAAPHRRHLLNHCSRHSAVFAGKEFVLELEELFHKYEVGIGLGEVERFGGLKYSGDQDQATVMH